MLVLSTLPSVPRSASRSAMPTGSDAGSDVTSDADGRAAYARRFRAVVEAEAGPVGRTLRYLGVPASELDDAAQEVFLALHRRWDGLAQSEPLGAWLRGVAVNVARNRRRARAASPVVLEAAPIDEPADPRAPEEALIERQRARRLVALLDALPDEERAAIVLFEVEGLSMKDVAVALGVSVPTAYRRVDDARAALAKALRKGER